MLIVHLDISEQYELTALCQGVEKRIHGSWRTTCCGLTVSRGEWKLWIL